MRHLKTNRASFHCHGVSQNYSQTLSQQLKMPQTDIFNHTLFSTRLDDALP